MSFVQIAFRGIRDGLNSFARRVHRYRNVALGVAACGCAGALTRTYLVDWSLSVGPSMYPTLPEETHRIVVDKRRRLGRGLQVGDVIQAESPQFANSYIGKRIIGLPGDYVVRDGSNDASVGGAVVKGVTDWKKRQSSESGSEQEEEEELRKEPEMIQVPEGHVWLAGDNMGWSRDSRTYGPVPMGLISGKSICVADGLFSWRMLGPGLRKVEDWEMDDILGSESEAGDRGASGRERQRAAVKNMGDRPTKKTID